MTVPPSKRKRAKKKSPALTTGTRSAARRSPVGFWIFVVLALVAAGLAAALLVVYPASHGPGEGREVELALDGDESPDALAGKLAGAGVVKDARLFALYVRASGSGGRVARGAHLLTDDLSPRELLTRIEKRGAGARAKVVIPEGWTLFDIGKRLASTHVCTKRAFIEAAVDSALLTELRIPGESAEGFLFPATYELPQDSDARDVVRRMKAEFDKRYAVLDERHASGVLDLSESLHWGMREIVILASMIEKEAVVDDERPVIASVFLNRLRDPKFVPRLLQCDPTAAYGCSVDPAHIPSCANFTGKIGHELVADPENPYNTYKHEGLPPGPISNPGAKSIEAVMAPGNSRYLYFVAKGGGRHTFSETYGAHAAAVDTPREKSDAGAKR